MSEMFADCDYLSEIDLSNFDTSSVKNMSYMFYDVNSEIINVSNFKTSLVEDMSFMFAKDPYYSPKKEQKIIGLTNFDTSKVTKMIDMFDYCSSEIDVSNFDTSSVKDMSGMFYGVNSTIINVTNFKTSSVEDMSYMFAKDEDVLKKNNEYIKKYINYLKEEGKHPEEIPIFSKQEIIGLTNFDT